MVLRVKYYSRAGLVITAISGFGCLWVQFQSCFVSQGRLLIRDLLKGPCIDFDFEQMYFRVLLEGQGTLTLRINYSMMQIRRLLHLVMCDQRASTA